MSGSFIMYCIWTLIFFKVKIWQLSTWQLYAWHKIQKRQEKIRLVSKCPMENKIPSFRCNLCWKIWKIVGCIVENTVKKPPRFTDLNGYGSYSKWNDAHLDYHCINGQQFCVASLPARSEVLGGSMVEKKEGDVPHGVGKKM